MTRFLLIRHAHHSLVGKALAGRSDEVGLDSQGIEEARALAERLARVSVGAVYSSPQRRARETAAPLAARWRCETRIEPAIDEVGFGEWTGRSFNSLTADPQWRTWCDRRSTAQPPGGEYFPDVQRRAVAGMAALASAHRRGAVALVSHGDVIKAILAHVLHVSLDDLERFDVAPASLSIVSMDGEWARVDRLNDSGAI